MAHEITGGRVTYKRTIQPQPYESKTVEVEFTFTVDPEDDPIDVTRDVLAMARDEVHAALGLKKKDDR